MATKSSILIEIDDNDEEYYALTINKLKLSTFHMVIADILAAIERGEYSEGQLAHPNFRITSEEDDGPTGALN